MQGVIDLFEHNVLTIYTVLVLKNKIILCSLYYIDYIDYIEKVLPIIILILSL